MSGKNKHKSSNQEQFSLTTYIGEKINYIHEHPYQTAALIIGTGITAYSINSLLSYLETFDSAGLLELKALENFGTDG